MKTILVLMMLALSFQSASAGVFELHPSQPKIWMDSCQGFVYATKAQSGLVTVFFENVRLCSNFEIKGSNGVRINFGKQKLYGANGNYTDHFDIPFDIVDLGHNEIHIQLKSNSYGTAKDHGQSKGEEIILKFKIKVPAPAPAPQPAPQTNPGQPQGSGSGC